MLQFFYAAVGDKGKSICSPLFTWDPFSSPPRSAMVQVRITQYRLLLKFSCGGVRRARQNSNTRGSLVWQLGFWLLIVYTILGLELTFSIFLSVDRLCCESSLYILYDK
jgi:hypothetical protein